MKTSCYLLVCALSFISCQDDFSKESELLRMEYLTKYSHSLSQWRSLKEINGNTYTYITGNQSWSGFKSMTTIQVENGQVVSRTYEQYTIDMDTKIIIDSYTETDDQIGTNDKGAPALSMDELYTYSQNILLSIDPDHNFIYLETGDLGLISVIGYSPKNCIDDCFEGVSIQSIEWE